MKNIMRITCREFSIFYSAQIDGRADENEQAELQVHMRECRQCLRLATEMRNLVSDLKGLAERRTISSGSIIPYQVALQAEAQRIASSKIHRDELMDSWRTRIFSQSIGAIVSLVMFVTLGLGVFRYAYNTIAAVPTDNVLPDPDPWPWLPKKNLVPLAPLERGDPGYSAMLKALVLQSPPPPALSPTSELLDFGAGLKDNDVLYATVKVDKDGRAKIEKTGATSNSSVETKFSSAIKKQTTFSPAHRTRNTSGEAVVIFGKMNISG